MKTHTTQGGGDPRRRSRRCSRSSRSCGSHHERWDGTGYPDRLAGEEIPLLARIVAVADAFDAMTSNRPYHENKQGQAAGGGVRARWSSRPAGSSTRGCAAAFLAIREQIVRTMLELMPGTELEEPVAVTVEGFDPDPHR